MTLNSLGPKGNVAKGWAALRRGLSIETEERVNENGVSYLGCKLVRSAHRTTQGQMATALTYDMSGFVDACIDKFLQLSGTTTLRPTPTPFLLETAHESPAGAPSAKGECVECPWRCHTFPPKVYPSVEMLDQAKKKTKKKGDPLPPFGGR